MAGNKKSQTKVVAELLDLIEAKLRAEAKGSLGDYIRLVQLQKEIEEEDPRDTKVGWVDKLETPKEETQDEETDKLETRKEETETVKTNEPEKDSGPSSS